MSFGGAAAAMNAAIEQNAALRGKRKFLGDPVPKTGSKRIKGMHHTASDATRKTLRAKYETERHADQYRE